MGKWLSALKPEFSESLGKGTDKTDKSPVSSFCQLVQHFGTGHQYLLTIEEIMAGLDADDITDLHDANRLEKQQWAEMLAYRLTKEKSAPTRAKPKRGTAGRGDDSILIEATNLACRKSTRIGEGK